MILPTNEKRCSEANNKLLTQYVTTRSAIDLKQLRTLVNVVVQMSMVRKRIYSG